jgi:hypothetical protein
VVETLAERVVVNRSRPVFCSWKCRLTRNELSEEKGAAEAGAVSLLRGI